MVQEKYDTWRLPCCLSGDRIATGSSFALLHLFAAHRSDGGDAAAVLLDCSHSRPSSSEKFRAHFLFLMPGAGFLLWRVAVGVERAVVLHVDSAATRDFLLDCGLSGTVVSSLTSASSPSGVCADS